jgi:hypothetical protein
MVWALMVAAFVVVAGPLQAEAQSKCKVVYVEEAQTFAESENSFRGTVQMLVGDQMLNVEAWTLLMGVVGVDGDGTQHAVTSHQFTTGWGATFTTFDETAMSPTQTPGVMELNEILTITAGTKKYTGATGQLVVNGTVDFTAGPPVATWTAYGKICTRSR